MDRKATVTFVALVAVWCGLAVAAQQEPQTSANSPRLKKILDQRPEADLNKDSVLTIEEAQQARRTIESQRAKPEAAPKPSREAPGAQPALADVPYGEHERNVLDLWQAKSNRPTPLFIWIHGGGFRAGDKSSIPSDLLKQCLAAGISSASINYRLSQHAPYPAQMLDSARAVQFLRSKAAEWNLDPKRFAAGGGSAGSGISQWIAYHDEMADPQSADPVAKQSTRLSCVFPLNMQSTYDPREIKRIVPGDAYKHPALLPLFGRPEGWDWDEDPIDEKLDAMLKDASPITHLTKDDPPIFLLQNAGAATPGNIHHPAFGRHLKEAADKLGVECVAKLDKDYESMSAAYAAMVEFMKKCFGK